MGTNDGSSNPTGQHLRAGLPRIRALWHATSLGKNALSGTPRDELEACFRCCVGDLDSRLQRLIGPVVTQSSDSALQQTLRAEAEEMTRELEVCAAIGYLLLNQVVLGD